MNKIMERVLKSTEEIWDKCIKTRFIREMMDGSLSKQTFLDYIVQDSIYLRDYLKAYAMAIYKSKSLRDMQMFYSVLGFVNDSENATRLNYLKDNNMTDDDVEKIAKLPACAAYTAYEMEISEKEDVPEILMAVLPCMIGYHIVFCKIKDLAPKVMDTYFGPLVADYTTDFYDECCKLWSDYTDEMCKDFDEDRMKKLEDIFVQASLHELYFWQMAGGEI